MANDVTIRWHNRSSEAINTTFQLLVIYRILLQQKWAMLTKSSEDKQFRHQIITFSEEKKNSSPNIIKILKLVTKSIFHHQRCINW